MSRLSTEQWERRKWYLIRSLFDDFPILSPIPETDEVLLDPLSPTEDAICRPIHKEFTTRSYSPLPDLIIEKEPNRHDEPEEYYQELEKKVMKYYKKLFLNNETSSDFSELDNDSRSETALSVNEPTQSEESQSTKESNTSIQQSFDLNFRDSTYCEEFVTCYSKKTFVEEEAQSRKEMSNVVDKNINTANSLVEASATSSESQDEEITITQALVHRTSSAEIHDTTHCMSAGGVQASYSEELYHSKENSTSTSPLIDTEKSDDEEPFLKTLCVSSARSSLEEPDIMRRQETTNDSEQSIYVLKDARYLSEDFTTDKRLEITSVIEMEEAEISSPELSIILGRSSPKITRNELEFNRNIEYGKRKVLSEKSSNNSTSSRKKGKFENLAIQTSFSTSDNESNWQEIHTNFFVGHPQIFKLCACSDHSCC